MCVECVSGQRNIITPMPIAMSPTVQALTAQRDALLAALEECVGQLIQTGCDLNWDETPSCVTRARAAIAKASAPAGKGGGE